MPYIPLIAGGSLALSIVSLFIRGGLLPGSLPGLLQLFAGVLLWDKIPVGVRRLSLLLAVVGIFCLAITTQSFPLATLGKNQQIIGMLAAIGLLRKIPLPKFQKSLPRGPKAFWQTLFALNWLASVMNMSALAIFSDRIAAEGEGRLNTFQGIYLARAFSLAALWSPMFIAMGVALVYAPGADYRVLMQIGRAHV